MKINGQMKRSWHYHVNDVNLISWFVNKFGKKTERKEFGDLKQTFLLQKCSYAITYALDSMFC